MRIKAKELTVWVAGRSSGRTAVRSRPAEGELPRVVASSIFRASVSRSRTVPGGAPARGISGFCFAGAAMMGDGHIALVIDPVKFIEELEHALSPAQLQP